jgi:hypothetical protein
MKLPGDALIEFFDRTSGHQSMHTSATRIIPASGGLFGLVLLVRGRSNASHRFSGNDSWHSARSSKNRRVKARFGLRIPDSMGFECESAFRFDGGLRTR